MDLQHLENNGGGGGGGGGNNSNTTEATMNKMDFQRLTQTITTSLQKIQQNGIYLLINEE